MSSPSETLPSAKSELDNPDRVARLERVRQFLEFIIRQLVEFPDEVMLSEIPQGRLTVFRLQMRQSDVGRIIGRNGQTIRAIRALLSSAAARHGQTATLRYRGIKPALRGDPPPNEFSPGAQSMECPLTFNHI